MPAPLRACAVSFLNAWPLVQPLVGQHLSADKIPRHPDGTPLFDLSLVLPSECARRLETGECDVALVPVAACAAHPEWEVVPEVGIGCRGPVHSVLLVSAVPLPQIERIYLDAASRTSVILVQLLLRAQGLSPECVHAPHREGAGLVQGTHAALVIGDAAMALHDRFPHVFDLGAMWLAQTGLPFVFAVWAARPGLLTPAHVTALQDARAYGLKHAEELAHAFREQQLQAGLPARDLLSDNAYANYLRRAIRYGLSTKEREGVVEFLSRATAAGLLTIPGHDPEDPVHIRFAGGAAPEALVAARRPRPPLAADELLARAAAGGRLDLAEGIFLYEHADLMALGAAADARRAALHPEGVVTYIIDRNVNYTNVCVTRCKFCNFYTPPGGRGGYVLSRDELARKFRETEELGGVQILLQGGLNPELGLEWYEDFFRWTKANFRLALHALSPTEIIHIAQLEDLPIRDVLVRLRAAGMDSLPGGGAEILDDEIRARISPFKNTADEWLAVMREAHALGMKTTATMVFGFQETAEQLVHHMDRVRSLQDETGGFTAFITWPFQADGTRLKLRDDTSPLRYLRVQALARLYLDNVPNLQVSWPTLGPEIGEVALRFGANDFGSVMIEENVVSQAGARFMMSAAEIEAHIRLAGFVPARRNMRYDRLPSVPSAGAPVAAPAAACGDLGVL
ncbi:cyclic dehypoxanthinyl futalosine synthase [Nannocystis pusilla]|uniref:cyclic dehypoxanthinyl futalosine synthase n=1 Tax=Nannocystis pusilla TaxID=889268 RepID=UPI003DA29C7F